MKTKKVIKPSKLLKLKRLEKTIALHMIEATLKLGKIQYLTQKGAPNERRAT